VDGEPYSIEKVHGNLFTKNDAECTPFFSDFAFRGTAKSIEEPAHGKMSEKITKINL